MATCALVFVFLSVICVSYAVSNTCTNYIRDHVCHVQNSPDEGNKCTAQYEGIVEAQYKLKQYMRSHIVSSYQYILLSTIFGNHKVNRPGFEALYRKLSDKTWEDTIELIKYNAKRGGNLANFHQITDEDREALKTVSPEATNVYEYNSLAKALDIQKGLAAGAHDIHKDAVRQGKSYHDPEISSFIENEFVHQHSKIIRDLAGHLTDLNMIMSNYNHDKGGSSLSLYLFDEYLQKSLGVV